MLVRVDKSLFDRAGGLAGSPYRLASLPRTTARAIEQLTDTMLAALHTEAGAVWLEHGGKIYTLVLRNINIQHVQVIQQSITACVQPYPTAIQVYGRNYAVACTGYPPLRVYAAVGVEALRAVHRRLMPRFARLAHTLLQTSNSPVGMPADDTSHQAYRMVVEGSLRGLSDLMRAAGCTLLWFSSWNNSWHRFAVGNVPTWLYQQLWEMPSPGQGLDVRIDGVQALIRQHGYHCVADEMTVRDMVKGCIFFWRDGSNGEFASDEVEWLRITVQMIAASLDVLETQTELLQKVYLDPLTGVFNRFYFELVYRQVLHNAQCHPHPVSLLLMDIDNFKQINDKWGHETGDMVLQMVGQALQQVRAGDVPARYGGDEFVVLLPDTDERGTRALAQRLQNALKQSAEQMGLPLALALSIGCATVTNGDLSLLLMADQDMYEQKRGEKQASTSVEPPALPPH